MKTFAVIPAWNEETRVGEVVKNVQIEVDGVIVVDDGSKDGTLKEAKAAGAIALRHAINRGQGAALKTGTEAALRLGADIIIHVDADGQHEPEMVQVLTQPIREGKADVVFGSRFLGVDPSGMPLMRRIYFPLARLFNVYAVGVSNRVSDPQSGARAMTAAAARRIAFHQDGAAHCSEILRLVTRSDLRWMEVPIKVRYTSETLKKGQKFSEAFRIVWHLILHKLK
jgi:polyprenyl-phospho-N-acetylgalactosaminyl synthase